VSVPPWAGYRCSRMRTGLRSDAALGQHMTRSGPSGPYFAVMHNTASSSDVLGCGPRPLMSFVKPRARHSPASQRTRCKGMSVGDRATVGASLETSVIDLLFAGSRRSVLRLGLTRSEVGRRSCDRPQGRGREFPLPWLRSRHYTRFIFFTGPCPGAGSL
jgi:hypothetical protein